MFLNSMFWVPAPSTQAPTSLNAPSGTPPPAGAADIEASSQAHGEHTVFIPSRPARKERPMVVMLHGAAQDPDDFAAGTTMNDAAERHGFVVLYPGQSKLASAYRCWNWFEAAHQDRGHGEPARIAALTQHVARAHGVDRERIYVAGLSAGGAMASLLGELFPEIYAAVGVHSGLAAFAGKDMSSGLAAMRGGVRPPSVPSEMPTIVFHGDRDTVVSPVNGMQVIEAAFGIDRRFSLEEHVGADGRRVTRRKYFRRSSKAVCGEHWTLHGASHAWSGGSAAGTFADPQGPDASEEMLRFFKTHRLVDTRDTAISLQPSCGHS
ncbi:PHB depolymerase family esterase [Variovorax robiniae]|uniref:PHB depolymerase family esterase n=1 Tax=Variovorax robiniae TaxID=1836199 RepID=A0ABU8XHP3_9BURK